MTPPRFRWNTPIRSVVHELVYVLDLDNGKDAMAPSFSKLVTCIVLALTVSDVAFFHRPLNAVHVTLAIACLAAAFGRSTFRSWLARYTATSDVKAAVQLTHTEIVTRQERDPAEGIDPA